MAYISDEFDPNEISCDCNAIDRIADSVYEIIEAIGDDPDREGVEDTPLRVARAYMEMFRGYREPDFNVRTFSSPYKGIIFKTGIPFTAHCEHHMCPFTGSIDFAYIPDGEVIGISKIIRLMQWGTSRLWIQEDMTDFLIDKFVGIVEPAGAAIIVKGYHTCEGNRGVRVPGVPTITSSVRGVFAEDPLLEQKFYTMVSMYRGKD